MRFFERRRGRRPVAPRLPADESQHGIRSALRRFVEVSTLISPPHNNSHHRQLPPIVTTLDGHALTLSSRGRDTLGSAHTDTTPIVLGESTLAHLQLLFKSLCRRTSSFAGLVPLPLPLPAAMAPPPIVMRSRLERFLRDVQRMPEDEVAACLGDKETFAFEDFLEILATQQHWDAQRPLSPSMLDLSEPISHYFVSSSHNTYLVGNQLSSDASVGEYREVLVRNCRCIEIDVWNPPARSGAGLSSKAAGKPPSIQNNSNSSSNVNVTHTNTNATTNTTTIPNGHRRHFSSSTMATSIHDGLDAVARIFTGRTTLSRSRASSFSQMSLTVPMQNDAASIRGLDKLRQTAEEEKAVPVAAIAAATAATASIIVTSDPAGPSRTETDMTDISLTQALTVSDAEGPAPSLTMTESTVPTIVTTLDESDPLATEGNSDSSGTGVATDSPEVPEVQEVPEAIQDGERPADSEQPAADSQQTAEPVTEVVAATTTEPVVTATKEPEPVVMHAHTWANSDWTLGTQVPFRDVCRAVRVSAFVDNPLPVIVSLEVHTNAMQQRQMVKIMREEWGDLLLDTSLEGTDPRLRLPTLGELMNKILVKVKKPPLARGIGTASTAGTTGTAMTAGTSGTSGTSGTYGTFGTVTSESSMAGSSDYGILPPPLLPAVVHHVVGLGTSLSAVASDSASAMSVPEDEAISAAAAAAMRNASFSMTPELGSLAVYTESKHFSNFSDRAAKTPSHIFSLSETAIQALHEKQHEELFQHNKKYLMRAYPNATKHVTSSNPDPARCWRRGVQMVALNWQTLDKAMMLNHAMFAGSHGWVLKPPGYRGRSGRPRLDADKADATDTEADTSPKCPVAEAEPTGTLHLTITVLAGHHLPLPPSLLRRNGGKTQTTTGIVSGKQHKDFLPVVKCELNVEQANDRCPELGDAGGASTAAGAPSVTGTTVESQLKKKTPAAVTDQPDWGTHGVTLQFANVAGIVESLSFLSIYVEDEGSKTPVSLGRNDALAGWACIRLDRLQAGYRFIDLMDAQGNATEGKLLVLIRKEML